MKVCFCKVLQIGKSLWMWYNVEPWHILNPTDLVRGNFHYIQVLVGFGEFGSAVFFTVSVSVPRMSLLTYMRVPLLLAWVACQWVHAATLHTSKKLMHICHHWHDRQKRLTYRSTTVKGLDESKFLIFKLQCWCVHLFGKWVDRHFRVKFQCERGRTSATVAEALSLSQFYDDLLLDMGNILHVSTMIGQSLSRIFCCWSFEVSLGLGQ